jgi:signal transduction histidine kinase
VLLNLLLNALDALPSGGSIHLKWNSDDRAVAMGETNWILIQVCDTGSGIPPDLGDQIFEPFVSSKDTGTGLGLTISRRIVEAHGGRIDAASRPEGGAIFTIRLPCGEKGKATKKA